MMSFWGGPSGPERCCLFFVALATIPKGANQDHFREKYSKYGWCWYEPENEEAARRKGKGPFAKGGGAQTDAGGGASSSSAAKGGGASGSGGSATKGGHKGRGRGGRGQARGKGGGGA